MRKFLLGLVFGLVVVGVANMGHALSLRSWSFGNHHHKSKDPHADAGKVNPNYYLNLPNNITPAVGPKNGIDGQILYTGGPIQRGTGQSSKNGGSHPAAVPGPATFILLGMGLIVLAGFERKYFKQ